jgi:hypothetical protein
LAHLPLVPGSLGVSRQLFANRRTRLRGSARCQPESKTSDFLVRIEQGQGHPHRLLQLDVPERTGGEQHQDCCGEEFRCHGA